MKPCCTQLKTVAGYTWHPYCNAWFRSINYTLGRRLYDAVLSHMRVPRWAWVSDASWQAKSRVTAAQTQDVASQHVWHRRSSLWFWMVDLLQPCGVTVWEATRCSYSSWEWQGGRRDCDSSHCGFGPVLFLSPGPCCSSTQRKCTRCCLGTNSVVWEAELCLACMILFAVYGFSTQQETGHWQGIRRQLSSDTGLIPRAWGQDVGLGDKSYFSMHMSAASIHLASALTFVVQKAFIQKQLCELRCCCITGSVRP